MINIKKFDIDMLTAKLNTILSFSKWSDIDQVNVKISGLNFPEIEIHPQSFNSDDGWQLTSINNLIYALVSKFNIDIPNQHMHHMCRTTLANHYHYIVNGNKGKYSYKYEDEIENIANRIPPDDINNWNFNISISKITIMPTYIIIAYKISMYTEYINAVTHQSEIYETHDILAIIPPSCCIERVEKYKS